MIEILKMTMNWGFPAFFCILWYFDLRKKTISLDNTISNHLTHALEANTKATKKSSESSERVERGMVQMSKSVDNLSSTITKFMEKK